MTERLTVLTLCVARAGLKEGARLADFIFKWEAATREAGRPITVEDYWRLAPDGQRTAYRRLTSFRRAFPQLGPKGQPDGLMGPLLEQLAAEAALIEEWKS